MFRTVQRLKFSFPEPFIVHKTTLNNVDGGIVQRSTTHVLEARSLPRFDEYSIRDILKSGADLRHVNTKVINNPII